MITRSLAKFKFLPIFHFLLPAYYSIISSSSLLTGLFIPDPSHRASVILRSLWKFSYNFNLVKITVLWVTWEQSSLEDMVFPGIFYSRGSFFLSFYKYSLVSYRLLAFTFPHIPEGLEVIHLRSLSFSHRENIEQVDRILTNNAG